MVSAKFQEVYDAMEKFKVPNNTTGNPTNDQKLDLYAWNKIARGEDITMAKKPGIMDVKGKMMRARWQKWVDEGVSVEDAEKRYIELGEELVSKYIK